ncbi:hypothetical protein [Actinocorallia sp. A-T 12471]|uniref:hypothetical protein n=1 Tax=Actinocorallia sp. A-T 12471 TaxID=3089813 RepID=UPI0029CD97CB|nr:hypothetical protein [Actinocorallia sp. A-T 12471]MDX6744349.1 hypothetical protein [Actinocorallia sp. A-T 12471]
MSLEQAAERHPEWRLWRSGGGGLVGATRRRRLSDAELDADLHTTLIEDDLDALIDRLREQEDRERAL